MKRLKTLFKGQFIWVLLVVVLALPVLVPLTKPGFFPTQDYIYVARLYQMNEILHDGQFPARWVPDFRYGEPLYNFYAPLPYYVGSLIKDLGFTYLMSVKILFALSFLLAGLSMYFLGRELFGKLGGLVAAVLYTYAPYHSVDIYVRGALSEGWSLVFLPLVFLGSLRLSKKTTVANFLLLVLSLGGLFYTHNIMTILFMPFVLLWMVFIVWREGKLKLILPLSLALVLSIALAASYILPAFLEKQFIQSQHLLTGYFNFRGHFVAAPQWFSTFWGYGASLWGSKDDMSFQVGLVQWAALALGTGLALLNFKRNKNIFFLMALLGLEFIFSLFMQHNKSAPIWETFSMLAFVQFPWRFLGISIFLISLMGGMVGLFTKKFYYLLSVAIIIMAVAANVGYFHPESYYLDSVDNHYLSSEVLGTDDKLPKDYLPVWVKKIDQVKISSPQLLSGKGQLTDYQIHSDWVEFQAQVAQDGEALIPVTYFPGWKALAEGKELPQKEPNDLGLIRLDLPKGVYAVKLEFADTPVRRIGNSLSLLAVLVVLGLFGRLVFQGKLAKNR